MFTMSKMFASYSVDDLDAAKQFYGELGLKVTAASDEHGPLWLHFAEIRRSCYTPRLTTRLPPTRS